MGLGSKLSTEIKSWGVLAIVVVIVSVVLLKFKNVSGVTSDLNTTIDTFVTAMSEPKNWVSIAIIALIGFGILYLFTSKKGQK